MRDLNHLKTTLDTVCADATRTGQTQVTKPPGMRRQLTKLRNELRQTLHNVDEKLAEPDKVEVDSIQEQAWIVVQERMKLPKHLRGSALVNEMLR